jgi:radical SAM superfamily enzyme YgiQ (UPF0313 family)
VSRVALCQDVMVEYMGFMCISAVLKEAGHTVELFFDDQLHDDRFIQDLVDFQPDIVAFSVLSPSLNWSYNVGRRIKEVTNAVTVYGNVHAITTPEIIETDGVDIVCLGEGELPMKELAECLDEKRDYSHIEGFWVKTPEGVNKNPMCQQLIDMDAMPFHDRDLYDKYLFFRGSKYLRVLTGRGCPFRCSFCTNPVLIDHYGGSKNYLRKQTPLRAIEELEYHISRRKKKVNYIFFIDEVFWVKNDWLREFLQLYKERIGIPYNANFRFGGIQEEDIKLMAESGAERLTVAVESGDEEQRKGIMNKPVKNDQILKIAGWMKKYGIGFGSSCFFGLPGDTVEDHVERLDFYRKVNPTYLWTTFFQPYPGLQLTKAMAGEDYLPEDKEFELTLHHDMYLDLPDRARLVNLKKVYFLCMKFPMLSPFLVWLTKFKIGFVFDLLFLSHFMYYIYKFERVSITQLFVHVRVFALNPFLRKTQVLQNIGKPFSISRKKPVVEEIPPAEKTERVEEVETPEEVGSAR